MSQYIAYLTEKTKHFKGRWFATKDIFPLTFYEEKEILSIQRILNIISQYKLLPFIPFTSYRNWRWVCSELSKYATRYASILWAFSFKLYAHGQWASCLSENYVCDMKKFFKRRRIWFKIASFIIHTKPQLLTFIFDLFTYEMISIFYINSHMELVEWKIVRYIRPFLHLHFSMEINAWWKVFDDWEK